MSLTFSKYQYSRSSHLKHHTQYKPKWSNQCHNNLQYQDSLLLNSTRSDINFTKVGINQIIKSILSHNLIQLQLKQPVYTYICMYDINTHVVYTYKFIYKINMCIYIHSTDICISFKRVCIISQPAAHKKPQCVYLSAEYGPL